MADNIHIKLPDGSDKEFPKGSTALDVARSISPRLADAALAAKIRPTSGNGSRTGEDAHASTGSQLAGDGARPSTGPESSDKNVRPTQADPAGEGARPTQLIDLTRPLEKDTELRILTEKDPEALGVYRHSSAHLLAAAVLELFPETKLGHGPATESGFFYDFYRPTAFTPEDLDKIEKKDVP